MNFVPYQEPIVTKWDIVIRIVLPIAVTVIVVYFLLPVAINSLFFGDYYKTVDGIDYHCYTGSDYLICDEIGDNIGYD